MTSGGGTYFPKGCFYEDVCNEKLFMQYSPTADDVWINVMLQLNNTPKKKVSDHRKWSERFIEISNSNDLGLRALNVGEDKNTHYINNLENKYQIKLGRGSNNG